MWLRVGDRVGSFLPSALQYSPAGYTLAVRFVHAHTDPTFSDLAGLFRHPHFVSANRRAREWKGEHEARYVAARAAHDARVARVQAAMDAEAARNFAQRLKRYGRAKAAQQAAATDARAHAHVYKILIYF